jgi:type II secretion system protein C
MIDDEGQSGPKEPKLQDSTMQLENPLAPEASDGDTNSVIERMAAHENREAQGEAPTTATRAVDVSLGNTDATHFISSSAASRDSSNRRRMEFLNMAEWVSQKVQNRGYAFYGKLATVVLSTYFLSDVAATIAGRYIPEPPPARMLVNGNLNRVKNIAEYNTIFTRNLFNHDGLIPGDDNGSISNPGGAPVKTTLPLNLIGTLILEDSVYSLATIEDKSASMIYPVRVDEEIPKKAKITKIEARKVIFLNMAAGRLEYVELPEDPTGATPTVTLAANKGPAIEKVGANQFSIPKAELDKTLADFNNVLTQARAVPYFENGVPAGYRFFQITPGSVYDKLGLKNGDVVAGINGQPLTDPSKAFEFLNSLKEGASHMELQLKTSDGKTQTNSYDFH